VNSGEEALAIRQIHALKARYFRFMDTKDWDGLRTVFTDDAVQDMSGEALRRGQPAESGITRGRDAIVDRMQNALRHILTVHHGHMPEIQLLSDTEASGIWAMEDNLRWEDPTSPLAELRGFGHYHETYRAVDGEWQIASSRLDRLRVDTTRR